MARLTRRVSGGDASEFFRNPRQRTLGRGDDARATRVTPCLFGYESVRDGERAIGKQRKSLGKRRQTDADNGPAPLSLFLVAVLSTRLSNRVGTRSRDYAGSRS